MPINQINAVTGSSNGIDVNELYSSCLNGVNNLGTFIQNKITYLGSLNPTTQSSLYQTEMLNIQFYMGQYNALLEMTSTVSKSLTDMMKTLAQRTG